MAERKGNIKARSQNEFDRVELRLAAARRALQAQRSSTAPSLNAHPASMKPQNPANLASILSPEPTSPPRLPFDCKTLTYSNDSCPAPQVMVMGAAFGQPPPLAHHPAQFGTRALDAIANEPLADSISHEEWARSVVAREEKRKLRADRKAKKAHEPANGQLGFLDVLQQAIMTPVKQITGFQDTSQKLSRNEYSARVYSVRRGVDVESYFVDGVADGHMNLRPLHEYLKDHKRVEKDIK